MVTNTLIRGGWLKASPAFIKTQAHTDGILKIPITEDWVSRGHDLSQKDFPDFVATASNKAD